jgi:hypothetical protein
MGNVKKRKKERYKREKDIINIGDRQKDRNVGINDCLKNYFFRIENSTGVTT